MRHVCWADPVIETARLVLRSPVASDLDWQALHLNTPAVMAHLGGVRSAEDLANGFAANAAALDAGEPGFWTVTLRSDGTVIGKCGLSRMETPAAPPEMTGGLQIGWSLGEAWWGHGYAGEAARTVIAQFFDHYDAPQLWAQTSDSNAASSRMMTRLGFARCLQFDYVDPDYPPEDNPTTVYCLKRADFQP